MIKTEWRNWGMARRFWSVVMVIAWVVGIVLDLTNRRSSLAFVVFFAIFGLMWTRRKSAKPPSGPGAA